MTSMRVAMIGYGFMGAAHSQGWRVAPRFFDLPATPEMTPARRPQRGCRRSRRRQVGLGRDRHRLARRHRARRHRHHRHRHPRRLARRDRDRRPRGRQARAVREAPRQHRRRGRGDGRRRRAAPPPAASTRWSASPTAAFPRPPSPATSSPPAPSATVQPGARELPAGLARRPDRPARLAPAEGARRLRRARRHRRPRHRPRPVHHRPCGSRASPARIDTIVKRAPAAREATSGLGGTGGTETRRRSPSTTSPCSPAASTSGVLGSFEATRFAHRPQERAARRGVGLDGRDRLRPRGPQLAAGSTTRTAPADRRASRRSS